MLTPPALTKPGLFVTGTDTGVGKTVVTCAIAARLKSGGMRVGVCKPFATGCRRERENLVSEDAEALAHFSDCRQPLDVINPVRYGPAVAPAVAAEMTGKQPDWPELWRAMRLLDESSDVMLVEGVGGIMVPLEVRPPLPVGEGGDPGRSASRVRGHSDEMVPPNIARSSHPQIPSPQPSPKGRGSPITVLDLASALGYPVLVVCRAGLGTLNHTAMTVRLLREAGCRVAGLVINGYEPEARDQDPAMASNRVWLSRMTGCPVLATVPRCPQEEVAPQQARLPDAVLDAISTTNWQDVINTPRRL